ncbi:hypothetical protein [Moraxella lacunata]
MIVVIKISLDKSGFMVSYLSVELKKYAIKPYFLMNCNIYFFKK